MNDQEDINSIALERKLIAVQEKLATKESECRELQKQLHELSKLALLEWAKKNSTLA